jgi:hypothetical protein
VNQVVAVKEGVGRVGIAVPKLRLRSDKSNGQP